LDPHLTKEQREVLVNYPGFKFEETTRVWRISVICNEEDVSNLLEEHRIPYKAKIHYNCEAHIFDGTYLAVIPNFGEVASIYGLRHVLQDRYPSLTPYNEQIRGAIKIVNVLKGEQELTPELREELVQREKGLEEKERELQ